MSVAVNVEEMVEVRLKDKNDFLKIRETLERIGIGYNQNKVLYPSCYILHKKGRYFLVHFKEMFMLDGKPANFSEEDKGRRNTIANLLNDWELLELVNPDRSKDPVVPLSRVKILPFKEKGEWKIEHKYHIGKSKNVKEAVNA